MTAPAVRAWESCITLPGYVLDDHDVHPLFDELYNKECYPYPFAALKGDRHKVRQKHLAVHLENEFLHLIGFPHFGGRIYSCRDKLSGHDLFHSVERIGVHFMPGEAGGTYSGCGVEISFPTHHSLTNVRKREYQILRNPDGSATIIMGELELRMRMRWEVHLTLRPGVARLEQEMRVHNRTLLYGRGRYWGNASILHTPTLEVSYPEIRAFEHGGEYGIASWPVYDGVDMRNPMNVPAPIGLEMKDVRNGYFACYDRERRFGMVHWAQPDEAPAKKYWTWGSSAHRRHRAELFGDGTEFLELQSGRVEDQEQYEIYPPFCLKRWREVWYPIRDIGPVHAAGPDVALSCAVRPGGAYVSLLATRNNRQGELVVDGGGRTLARQRVILAAGKVATHDLRFRAPGNRFCVTVLAEGKPLTTLFRPAPESRDTARERISVLSAPKELKTADDAMMAYELDLTYFRHKWTDFEEALRRVLEKDPNHAAAHRWMGIWLIRRGLHAEAERHLEKALARCAYDGEAHFYKGLCRLAVEDPTEAAWHFKMAFRHNEEARAAFMLGTLALRADRLTEALGWFEECLDANGNNLRGRLYRSIVLARLGRRMEAQAGIEDVRRRMPNEALTAVAEALIARGHLNGFLRSRPGATLARQLRADVQTYLELLCDLIFINAWKPALDLSEEIRRECRGEPGAALVELYHGYLLDQLGRNAEARRVFRAALKADTTYAFAFRREEERVIDCARKYFPRNGVVHHYLALIRAKQARYDEAYSEWKQALRCGVRDPVIYRALGTIANAHYDDQSVVEAFLDKALALSPDDISVRGDLLALAKARKDGRRFQKLISYPEIASTRLVTDVVNFLMAKGEYDAAVDSIAAKARFPNSCQVLHPLYELALSVRAFHLIQSGDCVAAEKDLRRALEAPRHLGTPVRMVITQARVCYLLGLAVRGQGNEGEARRIWMEALGEQEFDFWLPEGMWGYGLWLDRYWQGRMLLELGRKSEARAYFEGILAFAMSRTPVLGPAHRAELYRLARAGTSGAPLHRILADTSYLGME